jgi:hypothetical protein
MKKSSSSFSDDNADIVVGCRLRTKNDKKIDTCKVLRKKYVCYVLSTYAKAKRFQCYIFTQICVL